MERRAIQYITCGDLAEEMKLDRNKYTVIDVRDDDFYGGNIVNAHNIPMHMFTDNVQTYVDKYRQKPNIVFHCMKSQVRGPTAARYFAAKLSADDQCKVFVMEGGFETWAFHHRNNNATIRSLTENFREDCW